MGEIGDSMLRAAGKGGINMGFNAIGSAIGGAISYAYAKKMAKLNYKLNEKAADNADARRRALYTDFESPLATIRQLKEAGLSPSLYASGGIDGSIGSTAGAMGGGTAGMSMPSVAMSPIDISTMELQNAQARKLNAEADELEGKNAMGEAKIADLFASAGLKGAQKALTEAETHMQNIENAVADQTKEYSIAKIKYNAREAEYNANKAFWDAENAQFVWNVNVQTAQAQIDKIVNEAVEVANRAAYELSGARLNDAEAKAVKEYAESAIKNADAHKESADAYGRYVDNYKTIATQELEIRKDELNVKKWDIAVGAFTDILQAGMHMIGLNMFASGRSEKLVEHFDASRHLTGGTKTQTRRAGGRRK